MRLLLKFVVAMMLSTALFAMESAQMKQILNMTKSSWVSFRDYNGEQYIYFTHLESYRCGIKSVKYSINSDDLDKEYTLQPCNLDNPMAITTNTPYIKMPLGSAASIAVQLTFSDDTQSEVVHKTPN
ncbi:MAG: hypothetical protein JXQ76_09080 [Campylobacterales bacterium]|nr:hypothetical protein [Campylobacterales bacterium]